MRSQKAFELETTLYAETKERKEKDKKSFVHGLVPSSIDILGGGSSPASVVVWMVVLVKQLETFFVVVLEVCSLLHFSACRVVYLDPIVRLQRH